MSASVEIDRPCGWVLKLGEVDYERCLSWQRGLVKLRRDGFVRDTIIFAEHPPVVTVGKDGHIDNYRDLKVKPIKIERGGDVTYHGPGQQVVYFVFNLTRRGRDIHKFVSDLQSGIIRSLDEIGIKAAPGKEHTGVWVGKKKIASVGVAVKRWISFHGVAVNLSTNLEDFRRINPCGLGWEVMTSAEDQLGRPVDMDDFRDRLTDNYSKIFELQFDPVALETLAEDAKSQEGGFTV